MENNRFFPEIHGKFGFGCMRLPLIGEEVDLPHFTKMVDRFLEQGFNYFDTAHGYLGGRSELALKAGLTSRYPRDRYILTDKLTGNYFKTEADIRPFFQQQLEACGVEYFDFYLMHAQGRNNYPHFRECKAYETAFALKRLDYIESIFDDHAVIITGSYVKTAQKTSDGNKYLNNKNVKYNKQDKTSYLKNLESCFRSNQFINVRFADNEVSKMGAGGELFGIQIHQDYYSSSYSDTGYLFLMVDMNNPKTPIIKVRTWQPERDPNVNSQLERGNKFYGLFYGGNFD